MHVYVWRFRALSDEQTDERIDLTEWCVCIPSSPPGTSLWAFCFYFVHLVLTSFPPSSGMKTIDLDVEEAPLAVCGSASSIPPPRYLGLNVSHKSLMSLVTVTGFRSGKPCRCH